VGVFGVTGIADQRDFDQPYFAGYRISPRNSDDLTEPVRAAFAVESPWNSADGPIPLENLSTGAGSFFWSFGNGANSQLETPEYTYPSAGSYTLTLTASSTDGNCSDQAVATVNVVVTGVDELDIDFGLSPNPASDRLAFTCASPITGLDACDATGRTVAQWSFPGGQSSGQLDVSFLPAGVYTLRYTSALGTGAVRVLVGR
jgi:PKD repeat protein